MTDRDMTPHENGPELTGASLRMTAIAAVIIALVGLLGFAGWLAHGDTLFWSMLQAGLAWCL